MTKLNKKIYFTNKKNKNKIRNFSNKNSSNSNNKNPYHNKL